MTEIITDYLDAKQLADRLTALELNSTSELARLEQERDEALSQIAQAECRAERFCQERDDAREDLEEETKFHHRTHIELIQTQFKLLDMEMQRDEARDAILGWENKWKCPIDMAARAELERYEALKCAKEYYVEFIRNASSDNKVSKPNPLNPFYKYEINKYS
jgi:hypothetical protein